MLTNKYILNILCLTQLTYAPKNAKKQILCHNTSQKLKEAKLKVSLLKIIQLQEQNKEARKTQKEKKANAERMKDFITHHKTWFFLICESQKDILDKINREMDAKSGQQWTIPIANLLTKEKTLILFFYKLIDAYENDFEQENILKVQVALALKQSLFTISPLNKDNQILTIEIILDLSQASNKAFKQHLQTGKSMIETLIKLINLRVETMNALDGSDDDTMHNLLVQFSAIKLEYELVQTELLIKKEQLLASSPMYS